MRSGPEEKSFTSCCNTMGVYKRYSTAVLAAASIWDGESIHHNTQRVCLTDKGSVEPYNSWVALNKGTARCSCAVCSPQQHKSLYLTRLNRSLVASSCFLRSKQLPCRSCSERVTSLDLSFGFQISSWRFSCMLVVNWSSNVRSDYLSRREKSLMETKARKRRKVCLTTMMNKPCQTMFNPHLSIPVAPMGQYLSQSPLNWQLHAK